MALSVNYTSSLNRAYFYFISFISIRRTIPVVLSSLPIVLVPFTGICKIRLNIQRATPRSALSALFTPGQGVGAATSLVVTFAPFFSLQLSICETVPFAASFVGTPFFSFRGTLFSVYVGRQGRLSAFAAFVTALAVPPFGK